MTLKITTSHLKSKLRNVLIYDEKALVISRKCNSISNSLYKKKHDNLAHTHTHNFDLIIPL
jgi:hypothetical protein